MSNGLRALLACLWLLACCPVCLADSEPPAAANPTKILESFARQQPQRSEGETVIGQHEKQVIMFSIGGVLLALLIGTAAIGIAVAVFGKPLFLVHMILAGLTVTVALIHVVVGVVWFFPF
ncbi:MAG: hypothetical protein ABSC32_18730 [Steroidobacteraceae bacterium]|jgi:hypothetical protein